MSHLLSTTQYFVHCWKFMCMLRLTRKLGIRFILLPIILRRCCFCTLSMLWVPVSRIAACKLPRYIQLAHSSAYSLRRQDDQGCRTHCSAYVVQRDTDPHPSFTATGRRLFIDAAEDNIAMGCISTGSRKWSVQLDAQTSYFQGLCHGFLHTFSVRPSFCAQG